MTGEKGGPGPLAPASASFKVPGGDRRGSGASVEGAHEADERFLIDKEIEALFRRQSRLSVAITENGARAHGAKAFGHIGNQRAVLHCFLPIKERWRGQR